MGEAGDTRVCSAVSKVAEAQINQEVRLFLQDTTASTSNYRGILPYQCYHKITCLLNEVHGAIANEKSQQHESIQVQFHTLSPSWHSHESKFVHRALRFIWPRAN